MSAHCTCGSNEALITNLSPSIYVWIFSPSTILSGVNRYMSCCNSDIFVGVASTTNWAANSASSKSKVMEGTSTSSSVGIFSTGASGCFILFSLTKNVNLPSAVLLLPYSSHNANLHSLTWCNNSVSSPVKFIFNGNLGS